MRSSHIERIDAAQRRARLARRHHLATEALADDPVTVAADLVAVHGTDPTSVHLKLCARTRDGAVAAVSAALHEQRSLIRLLAMRRTIFVTTRELAPVIQAGAGRDVAARERRKLLQWLAEAGVASEGAVAGEGAEAGEADVESWLSDLEEAALAALTARGEATATELAGDDPRLRLTVGRGTRSAGQAALSSRVLLLLAAEGLAVRGRPRGSWASSAYRWAPMTAWYPGGLPELPTEDAAAELARRWLWAYGPATVDDLRWWTGWPARQARAALARVAPVKVDLDGAAGVALADDLEPEPPVDPWGALLPPLDATTMGWRHREWFLGPHAEQVFDAFGNAGPTAWWDGRVVGGWAQRPDGEIAVHLLEDVGADAVAVLEEQAQLLAARLGSVRMSARARGRTDVERTALA